MNINQTREVEAMMKRMFLGSLVCASFGLFAIGATAAEEGMAGHGEQAGAELLSSKNGRISHVKAKNADDTITKTDQVFEVIPGMKFKVKAAKGILVIIFTAQAGTDTESAACNVEARVDGVAVPPGTGGNNYQFAAGVQRSNSASFFYNNPSNGKRLVEMYYFRANGTGTCSMDERQLTVMYNKP